VHGKRFGRGSTTKMMWACGKRATEGKRDRKRGQERGQRCVHEGGHNCWNVVPFFCMSLLHLLPHLALLPCGAATQLLLPLWPCHLPHHPSIHPPTHPPISFICAVAQSWCHILNELGGSKAGWSVPQECCFCPHCHCCHCCRCFVVFFPLPLPLPLPPLPLPLPLPSPPSPTLLLLLSQCNRNHTTPTAITVAVAKATGKETGVKVWAVVLLFPPPPPPPPPPVASTTIVFNRGTDAGKRRLSWHLIPFRLAPALPPCDDDNVLYLPHILVPWHAEPPGK